MTNAEFVVLSLIMEEECYGYEIEQVIEERSMRNWTEIGFSSIYYLLRKLEKENLIESRLESATGKGPARKVYSVTDAGKKACLEATRDAIRNDHRSYPPIMLGLNNLFFITKQEALQAAKEHHTVVAERLKTVDVTRSVNLPVHVRLMFEYSQMTLKAELEWTERLIVSLEKGEIYNREN